MNERETADSPVRKKEYCSNEQAGIDSVPHQLVKTRMKEGFVFNILLIGETGIGKTTLISSLFNIPSYASSHGHGSCEVKLKSHTYDLCEKGVNLTLTIVETIGYGDQINRKDSVEPIIKYIDNQFEKHFREELTLERSTYHDTRIHACLYFICPTGHSLKPIDVFCMKQLHEKVNIIPIVSRADSLSKTELQSFKSAIKSAIEEHGIKIYIFPTEDEDTAEFNSKSNELVPFAVLASGERIYVKGKLTRARSFPWGTIIIEDAEHSEFLALRQALIETNMEDLREKTNEYYEKYRLMRASQLGFDESISADQPVTFQNLIEEQRKKQKQEMLAKEEALSKRFVERLKQKEAEWKIQEESMHSKYKKLFEQLRDVEDNIRHSKSKLELEILAFTKKKGMKSAAK